MMSTLFHTWVWIRIPTKTPFKHLKRNNYNLYLFLSMTSLHWPQSHLMATECVDQDSSCHPAYLYMSQCWAQTSSSADWELHSHF